MKTFINLVASVLVLLAFYGCNADVFVDDFKPSVSELTLDGNGDETTIRFKASNWDVLEISSYSSASFNYKVYDANGKLTTEQNFPYLKGLGKIVLEDKDTEFTVERSTPEEVKITVGENVRSDPFQFILVASNEYEFKDIYVTISPSDRYVFDRITYSLDTYFYDEPFESTKRLEVHNSNGGGPVGWTLFPFKNKHRKVMFTSDDPEAFNLLEKETLTLEIPSIVGEGSLQMNGEQAQYIAEVQSLPLPFPDTEEKEVIIPPYTSQLITLLMQYEWFETGYILYASHPKTGKQRIITGALQSRMPKKYYITREALNE